MVIKYILNWKTAQVLVELTAVEYMYHQYHHYRYSTANVNLRVTYRCRSPLEAKGVLWVYVQQWNESDDIIFKYSNYKFRKKISLRVLKYVTYIRVVV